MAMPGRVAGAFGSARVQSNSPMRIGSITDVDLATGAAAELEF